MDIALKNVTEFKTIMYEFSKGEDYRIALNLSLSFRLSKLIIFFIDNWDDFFFGRWYEIHSE